MISSTQSLQFLGTAHYLMGVRGWKYRIRGNNFFVKTSIWDSNFFSKHIYGTRTFLTETENCSRGSWWLYLSGKDDIFMENLTKT